MREVIMYKSESGKAFETIDEATNEDDIYLLSEFINKEAAYGDTICCTVRELSEKIVNFLKTSTKYYD